MTRSRVFFALLVGAGVVGFLWFRRSAPPTDSERQSSTAPTAPARSSGAISSSAGANPPSLADALNSPAQTIRADVELLRGLFENWQTNFPGKGNPIGTNTEITAALTGRNDLRLDLIPRDHPAINRQGELCDRWGTPFRFHQLSGTEMQVISAGPDRDFATEDDVAAP